MAVDILTLALAKKMSGASGGGAVQSDWNQNDEAASDYIKNRPFYESNGLDVISECEISSISSDSWTGGSKLYGGNVKLPSAEYIYSKEYTIEINGEAHVMSLTQQFDNMLGGYFVGFNLVDGETVIGYPKFNNGVLFGASANIYSELSEGDSFTASLTVYLAQTVSLPATIRVGLEAKTLVQLDPKYLPEALQFGERTENIGDTLFIEKLNEEDIDESKLIDGTNCYYVSNAVVTMSDLQNGCVVTTTEGSINISAEDITQIADGVILISEDILSVSENAVGMPIPEANDAIFPQAGIYIHINLLIGLGSGFIVSLTIPGYNFTETTIRTINSKYLPNSVKAIPDWNQHDETQPDYVKNRTHYIEPAKTVEIEINGNVGNEDSSGLFVSVDADTARLVYDNFENATFASGNGTSYKLSVIDSSDNSKSANLIKVGASAPSGGIAVSLADNMIGTFSINGGGIWGILSVEKPEEIHALDPKYLPNSVAHIETGASVGQTIVVKAVDDNGKPTEWESIDPWVINSSTEESTKKFKITVDDNGTITATEVT